MPSEKYEEFEKDWQEKQKTGRTDHASFLIGEPIPWPSIQEGENKKDWIWENYIAKGHITLLSALWKAGKSTLLRCLFLALAQEEEFAGQPTKKSKVLVLSEEAKGEWSDRREDIDESLISQILVWSRPIRIKPNLRQWSELIEEVTKKCVDEKIDMVVIDTLTTFWPIDNENDSAQVIKALVPLYNFTESNIAVLLIHHFRKGGGDQAQASRGSGALPGFVDNIIEFTRKEDGLVNQRILKTYGRFDAVIPQVVIELDNNGKYKTLGAPWEVSKSARLYRIVQIFEEHSSTELCTADIHTFWVTKGDSSEISLRSIRSYLKELELSAVISAVDSRLNGKKMTNYYILSRAYQEQRKIAPPYTIVPFLSAVPTAERGSESLSAVDPQFVPVTAERKGISPKGDKNNLDDTDIHEILGKDAIISKTYRAY